MTTLALPLVSGVWSGATRRVTLGAGGVHGQGETRESRDRDFIKLVLLFDESTVAGHGMEAAADFKVHGWWGEHDILVPPVRELAELELWQSSDLIVRLHLVSGKHEAVCHLWRVESGLEGFWWRETN